MIRLLSIFGILISMFAGAVNWSIVNMAAPSIQMSLDTSISSIQWLLNVFSIAMVPFLVMAGRFADVFGRKRIYIIGNILFLIPSFLGGMSTEIHELILWRGLQGFATAILLPISLALLTMEYPAEQHSRGVGLWMLTIGVGCGIGPLLGGMLVSVFSWNMIFYFNIPFFILSIIFCGLFTAESSDEHSSNHLDIPGNITLIIALAALIYGIIEGPNAGWLSWQILASFSVAVLFGILFYAIETHTENPIIEFHLYANERFTAGSVGAFYAIFYVWAVFFLMPLYLQNIVGYEPLLTGIFLLAITVPFAIISHIIGKLENRIRYKYFILAGVGMYSAFTIACMFAKRHPSHLLIIGMLVAFGIGWAFLFGPSVSAGMTALPKSKTGIAAGSLNTFQEIGGGLGLAICGSMLRYSGQNKVLEYFNTHDIKLSPEQLQEVNGFLSNPQEAMKYLSSQGVTISPMLEDALYDGFVYGLDTALYILLGLSVAVFFFILFFMKKPRKQPDGTFYEKDIPTRT